MILADDLNESCTEYICGEYEPALVLCGLNHMKSQPKPGGELN